MNFDEFKEELEIGLGGGLVDVELEDKEYRLAFNKAKRTFIQKGNNSYRKCFLRLPVSRDKQTYMIPKDIHTVVKVIKPTTPHFTVNDEFSLVAYNQLFGQRSNADRNGDWLSYEFTLQLIERWRRYMAYDVQFQHDVHRGTITFLKPSEKQESVWLLECYTNLGDEEYMDNLWIQSWALAEAKGILGASYSKFPSLPGPDGTISLDGRSLVEESKREKEQLLEDIANGVDGEASFYEITFG